MGVPTPTVDAILTTAVVYPTPPSVISIEEIVPAAETIAVAAAPVRVSCLINVTLFWKVSWVTSSFSI